MMGAGSLAACPKCGGKGGFDTWSEPCLKTSMHYKNECAVCRGKCYLPGQQQERPPQQAQFPQQPVVATSTMGGMGGMGFSSSTSMSVGAGGMQVSMNGSAAPAASAVPAPQAPQAYPSPDSNQQQEQQQPVRQQFPDAPASQQVDSSGLVFLNYLWRLNETHRFRLRQKDVMDMPMLGPMETDVVCCRSFRSVEHYFYLVSFVVC